MDLPIPKTPEQLYGTATPIPIPIQEDYALNPNNCPDYAPISTPMTPIPPRLTGKSPNNSLTVCPPCLSNIAILWVSRYFALSHLVLYGSLWLFSCVSGLCLEIPVVLPVFPPLSGYQSSHVAHGLC